MVVLVLVGSAPQPPGHAETTAGGVVVLDDPTAAPSWAGSFQDVAAPSDPTLYGQPGVCDQLGCQESLIEVALPTDVWAGHPGGVQIAIGWAPHEEYDLDLYVYGPDGSLVGRSDGLISTGESGPGSATRPTAGIGPSSCPSSSTALWPTGRSWRWSVIVPRPVRPLLPNLVTLPVRNPTMRTGAYFADHHQGGTPSCYPEEVAEQAHGGACASIRSSLMAGTGPSSCVTEWRVSPPNSSCASGSMPATARSGEVTVDTYEFHPTHAHFHYKNFGQAFLYRLQPDGTLQKVRESRKNGFCMIDVDNIRFGLDEQGRPYKGEAPRTYYAPRCNTPTEHDEHGTYMVNGISVGWADVYNWFLADQYIEVSGVPDGVYVIETVANPDRTVHETSVDDNTARTVIRLTGNRVELIG